MRLRRPHRSRVWPDAVPAVKRGKIIVIIDLIIKQRGVLKQSPITRIKPSLARFGDRTWCQASIFLLTLITNLFNLVNMILGHISVGFDFVN